MRLEQLRCLVEVAKHHSLSKAAEQMYMTQQAVSLNIKQLEKELDSTLLVRNSKGVILTEAGKETVTFAEQVLLQKNNLTDLLNQLEHRQTEVQEQHIRISSISTVTNIVLPKIIGQINKEQKNVKIRMDMVDTLETVIKSIRNQESDIGLITFNEKELMRIMEEFQGEILLDVLARDEMIGVVNRKHYNGEVDYIRSEDYFGPSQLRTIYNITPVEKMRELAQNSYMIVSNDADFHRNMLKYADAIVIMAGFAYEYFFSSKNFIALPVEGIDVPLIHAAIYHKNADSWVEEFVKRIRKEMHVN